ICGPVQVCDGATLAPRAGMEAGSVLGAGAVLGPLSWLPAGATVPIDWRGTPLGCAERPAYARPACSLRRSHPGTPSRPGRAFFLAGGGSPRLRGIIRDHARLLCPRGKRRDPRVLKIYPIWDKISKNPMLKTTLTLSLGLALCALPSLNAQTPAKPSATAAAPKGAHPKSKAEGDALSALNKLAKDANTTPDQINAAVTDFNTKYPTSDYLGSVAVFALQYFQTPPHVSYEQSLLYGEMAIKADPTSVYALTTMGDIIPNQVKDT